MLNSLLKVVIIQARIRSLIRFFCCTIFLGETGYNVLVYAIAVCIVGGLGSWTGAVMGAFVLGFAQILTVRFIGAQWQMVVVFLAIILTLILRPSGLFGRQKELEERV